MSRIAVEVVPEGLETSAEIGNGKDLNPVLDDVRNALAAVADALLDGEAAVELAAEASFAGIACVDSARLLVSDGPDWRYANGQTDLPLDLAGALNEARKSSEVSAFPCIGMLVPVSPGAVAVLPPSATVPPTRWPALQILAAGVRLALASAAQSRGKLDALEEIRGLQDIAIRILSAGDLSDILFAISQETKRLLRADICGVFLRDGDEMVMRDCIGNLTRNIAKIRLLRGQGLAGRVFQTGRHCIVGDYLTSDAVSQEYAELVRAERIRSALGAPLTVDGDLIGVLEVWRRRKSTFTEADVRRLLTLSTLTSIAIHNAKLFESQKNALEQLTQVNERLRQQNDIIRQSAAINGEVIQGLVDGGGLSAIARVVARYAGAEVAFLNAEFEPLGDLSLPPWCAASMQRIMSAIQEGADAQGGGTRTVQVDSHWLAIRAAIAGRDRIGWLCARSSKPPDELHEIAIGQAAMAVALHHAEQRAAAHARTHTIDGVAWDLLEGREQARAAAAAGARQLQIDLSGPLRVLHLVCVERSAGNERMPTVEVESRRGFARQIAEGVLDRLHVLRLVSARGNLIVAVVVASDVENLKEMIKSVDNSISRSVPGLRTSWGISSKCRGAKELHTAHREAASALILANKLGQARNIAIYDQLGIVGLLLKVRNDIDLETYVADTLGKVLAYDSGHHGVLTKTVRTYFECNCSQKLTAQMLHVHEKTVRYRLGRFEALSKLDLGRHEDRLRVDLALSMEAITPEAHSAGDKSAAL